MQHSYVRVNIAVQPPEEVLKEAVSLSQKISKDANTYFTLDASKLFPHITLYSPEYPIKNLDTVYKTVNNITKTFSPFNVHFNTFRSHLGYIDIAFEKTDEWIGLHKQIVNSLNPLRENHLRDEYLNEDELKKYNQVEQKHIRKYGYSEVFDTFTPHLTLTRLLSEDEAKKTISNLNFSKKEFQANKLAAYSMGSHGTCTEILKEFRM